MNICDFVFSGKHYTDISTQVELLDIASKLPICAFHSSYNIGESLKAKSKVSAWWTYQGVSVYVKASFKGLEELQGFMCDLNWSDRLKPGQAESVFEEMLKIAVDSPALPE